MKTALLALVVLAASASLGSCNVLETAMGAPELSTLVSAIEAAGLTEVVGNLTTGTVLAPTNDAFDAALTVLENLGVTVSSLADIPTDALREALAYHILVDFYNSTEIAAIAPTELDTLLSTLVVNATALTVGVTPDGVVQFIPSSGYSVANVTTADVAVAGESNVTVHIINNVLFPTEALM
ncbi:hypothetical protein N2152v2_011251 [Parachlorella kessleri]